MGITSGRVSVTSATAVLSGTAETDLSPGQYLLVTNRGSASVDLGPSTVVSGAAYELAAGDTIAVDLESGELLYAVAASGTVRVDVLRAGL